MRPRRGVSQYLATVLLVAMSLSLASLVYSGVRNDAPGATPVFASAQTTIGGQPPIVRVQVNASVPVTLAAVQLDSVSSTSGTLYFDGSAYHASSTLCADGAGYSSFFSVYTPQAGTITVNTNGQPWISGTWESSDTVSPGWHEVIVVGGTQCTVTLPGGATVTSLGASASSIPLDGPTMDSSVFTFYIPATGLHQLLVTTSGGLESLEVE